MTPRVWFSSDLHLGHARILSLCDRPFPDVDSHDEQLIARHNALVGPDDIVINTGDVCLGDFARSLRKTARMSGRRFLLPGNHDRVSDAFERGKNIARYRAMYEEAGWTVLPEQVQLSVDGVRFCVSHYPYRGDHTDTDRYALRRPPDAGLPLIHGHIHRQWRTRGRMFNVGVDVNGYAPVPADTLTAFARSLPAQPVADVSLPVFDVRCGQLR